MSIQPHVEEVKAKKSTKGEVFYNYFRTRIDSQILGQFENFVKPLMSLMLKNPIAFHILLNLIDKHVKAKTISPTSARHAFLRCPSSQMHSIFLLNCRPLQHSSSTSTPSWGMDEHRVNKRAKRKCFRVFTQADDA